MSRVTPTLVTPRHAYTAARVPWQTDPDRSVTVTTANGHRFGWRLFRYLSGGGMSALGRSSSQELQARRRAVFLIVAGILFACWILFMLLPPA